jgi:hypothetical protein
MAKLEFEARITYKNQKQLPASLLKLIKAEPGVTIYEPIFVDASGMQALRKSRNSNSQGQGLSTVAGLTVPAFGLSFSDIDKQWTKKDTGGAVQWLFSGGKVYFDIEIAVYMLQGYDNPPKAYAAIVEHEYLHVYDDIVLVNKTLPEELLKDDTYTKPYLVDGKAVSDSTFQYVFKGDKYGKWVEGIWAEKRNEREQFRDSEEEYKRFRDRIDDARSELVRPHGRPELKQRQKTPIHH